MKINLKKPSTATILLLFLILILANVGCRFSLNSLIGNNNSVNKQNVELSTEINQNSNDEGEKEQTPTENYSFSSGHIEEFTITIPQLGDRIRTIEVYLPPDYFDTENSYPVIYLLDGKYVFNPQNPKAGDYRIDETLDKLFNQGTLNGMIAVGIRLDKQYLWSEYSPWVNHNMYDWIVPTNGEPEEGGEGFAFLEFIVNTLKPEVDSRYRTLADRENTAIGGFCRTAIIPIVAGLNYPDVFTMVMAMSPTVWFTEEGGQWLSNNHLINLIVTNGVDEDVRFFIHVGTEEASGNRPPIKDQHGKRITYPRAYVEGAENLSAALIKHGAPSSNVFLEVIEGSSGGRDFWGSRFSDAILWLFEIQENL